MQQNGSAIRSPDQTEHQVFAEGAVLDLDVVADVDMVGELGLRAQASEGARMQPASASRAALLPE